MFKRKSKTQSLEIELAALRQRAGALEGKRLAAEAELGAATEARQRHLVEGDIDDAQTARQLQDAVNVQASIIIGLEDALAAVATQIAETERKIDADRTQAERTAAADAIGRDLDVIEKASAEYLASARRFADAIAEVGQWHYESAAMATLVRGDLAQIEVAAPLAVRELRGTVEAIRTGSLPIPRKPVAAPPVVIEQLPEITRVFMLKSAKYFDHLGRLSHAGQYTDCDMPPVVAQRALRYGIATRIDDPRRHQLLGAKGGAHVNANAIDIADLTTEEAARPPHIAPVRFEVVDRSAEERKISYREARVL
jgi:hypothetical protein